MPSNKREKIYLNPDFNIDEAFRQKKKKGQGIVIDKSENIKLNPEHAKYDRIKSHLLNRNGQLTIVFKWDDFYKRLDIGLATEWGYVYGNPPSKREDEIAFADLLFEKWIETTKMGEDAVTIRTTITGGQV